MRYRIATSFSRASEPSGLCINRRSCRKWIRCDPPSTKYNTVRTMCLILCITVTPHERLSVSNRSQLNYIYSTARSGWKRRKHKGFEVLLAFCDRWIPIKVAVIQNEFPSRDGHDDVIKWKHFPSYWLFARGIHRSPVNSPHKDQWRGALIFSFISAWIKGWVNWGWWFEKPSCSLWRHCNDLTHL